MSPWGSAAVDPPDGPFGGLGVVGADGDAVGHAGRLLEAVFLDVAAAAHEGPFAAIALELGPRAVLHGTLDAVAHAPVAHQEVEVLGARQVAGRFARREVRFFGLGHGDPVQVNCQGQ